jgi:beta-lactamase class A
MEYLPVKRHARSVLKRSVIPLLLAVVMLFGWPLEPVNALPPLPLAQTQLLPQQAIERLFTSPRLQTNWFDPSFLQVISTTQVEQLIQSLVQQFGAFQRVESANGRYQVVLENAEIPTQISLNSNGRIAGLLFEPPTQGISLEEAIAQLQSMPGTNSLLVYQGDRKLADLNTDQPLAVGSAFKLVVLQALQQQIAAGDRHWSDVVTLKPEWKSLPSGILQDWPNGSPLTIETLATLMISLSDNTATDALIDLVGAEVLEQISPRNRPFLTTRALFALKNPENAALLAAYRQGDAAQKRAVLAQAETAPLPSAELFQGNPIALDVEWLISTQELCQMMSAVSALPLTQVNPGVAKPAEWASISYKGGSEPGVLNLTTWLQPKEGQPYCVSATWNNPEARLDESALVLFYGQILSGLALPAS